MREISAVIPDRCILQHILKGVAEHKGHGDKHKLIQLLVHDLCRFDDGILRQLQGVIFHNLGSRRIREHTGDQNR
ncbi:hypothetical protein D3C77_738350 [compost metagenome]